MRFGSTAKVLAKATLSTTESQSARGSLSFVVREAVQCLQQGSSNRAVMSAAHMAAKCKTIAKHADMQGDSASFAACPDLEHHTTTNACAATIKIKSSLIHWRCGWSSWESISTSANFGRWVPEEAYGMS